MCLVDIWNKHYCCIYYALSYLKCSKGGGVQNTKSSGGANAPLNNPEGKKFSIPLLFPGTTAKGPTKWQPAIP